MAHKHNLLLYRNLFILVQNAGSIRVSMLHFARRHEARSVGRERCAQHYVDGTTPAQGWVHLYLYSTVVYLYSICD